jgi:hypothetical protein
MKEQKPTIRWKIVKVGGEKKRFESIYVQSLRMGYNIGEETHAPVGGCLVFKTREAAIAALAIIYIDAAILKCEVREQVKLPTWRANTTADRIRLENVWNRPNPIGNLPDWPPGTEAWKVVKPLSVDRYRY